MQRSLIRHGDLLLSVVAASTLASEKVRAASAPIVLSEGETSGHLHRLNSPFFGATMYHDAAIASGIGNQYIGTIKDFGGGDIRHEFADGTPTGDHDTLDVPPGDVTGIQQREYDARGEQYAPD